MRGEEAGEAQVGQVCWGELRGGEGEHGGKTCCTVEEEGGEERGDSHSASGLFGLSGVKSHSWGESTIRSMSPTGSQ